MPKTLIHGDVAGKNARIRTTDSEIILFPLDWETAGWASPAADLESEVDLSTYWSVVHPFWPNLRFEDLQQLSIYGRIFRVVQAIRWESHRLEHEWVGRPMRHFDSYHSHLADSIRTAGWEV